MQYFLHILYFIPFLYLLYSIFLYFFTRVPIIFTPQNYQRELLKHIEINNESVVYEFGCGKAAFLYLAEKQGAKKLLGFELSLVHVAFINLKSILLKSKVRAKAKNFFKADIQDSDIIYMFLVLPVVNKAWEKIKKEAKAGTLVITLSDKITGVEYIKKIATRPGDNDTTYFYLYEV